MPVIKSVEQEVQHSAEKIFNFLTDFNNFKDLLPADKIENWSSTAESCSFTVSGMINLQLLINEKNPFSKVNYVSAPGSKYKFDLTVNIDEKMENNSVCSISMIYDINPFLNGFAEKPLTGLINKMVEELARVKL
jgi:hypothetical protein